jgi:hypothetical protein
MRTRRRQAAEILSLVREVPPSDVFLFPEYILPAFEKCARTVSFCPSSVLSGLQCRLPQSPELRSKGVAAPARLSAEGNFLLLWITGRRS